MRIFILLVLLFFLFPSRAYAIDPFSVSSEVLYIVSSEANTKVQYQLILTNTSEKIYAPSYTINIGFNNIHNLKASDPRGAVAPELRKTQKGAEVTIPFNTPAVGVGKSLPFSLSFETEDVASKLGNVWEITIPPVSQKNNFTTFNATVIVPPSLGSPTYIKPNTFIVPAEKTAPLVFTKIDLEKSGVSIGYGQTQIYAFTLTYQIQNKNLFPGKTEIAIPPSTNYQIVSIESMNPEPTNVTQDSDGNWLAKYSLFPSEKKQIVVKGTVLLSLYPKKEKLTEEELKEYTKSDTYWQTEDITIKELAQKLKTPFAIYEYVTQKLTYDFSRVEDSKPRSGALLILKNTNSATCLEFTDLFIALARAAGIPAREVDGYAFTDNATQRPLSLVKDILHSWPEFYDKELQTWIMVDPTWANTTGGVDYFNIFDVDHFAFVVKGKNSMYPIPAGGYKFNDNSKKNIDISFAKTFEVHPSKIELSSHIVPSGISGFPLHGEITVKNMGSTKLDKQNIQIVDEAGKISDLIFTNIPPFGSSTLLFSIDSGNFLTNKTEHIKITAEGNTINAFVRLAPFYTEKKIIFGGIISGIFIIFATIIAIRSGGIPIFNKR